LLIDFLLSVLRALFFESIYNQIIYHIKFKK